MATYHLYHLRNGALIGSEDIEALDDGDAARIARQTGNGQLVEIWSQDRRIRIVPTAQTASAQLP